ncbi:MAG: twin-arginine translocase TatA/TatE family subunit [Dehalococcoidia bacterium]|nr:twin-arginine translocase TatA/TatE family subunit [Dehalococcoidia bacterium]
MFGSLGAPELIIIGLIIVLLFGVGKISGLGREVGSSIKEFRKAVKDEDKENEKQSAQQAAQVQPPQHQAPQPQYQQQPPYQQPQYAPPPQPQQVPPQQFNQPPAPPAQPRETKNIF